LRTYISCENKNKTKQKQNKTKTKTKQNKTKTKVIINVDNISSYNLCERCMTDGYRKDFNFYDFYNTTPLKRHLKNLKQLQE
jgi:hypothetical protein